MKYEIKDITNMDLRARISNSLIELENIAEDDLCTFELMFLRKFAKNAPKRLHGKEEKILS